MAWPLGFALVVEEVVFVLVPHSATLSGRFVSKRSVWPLGDPSPHALEHPSDEVAGDMLVKVSLMLLTKTVRCLRQRRGFRSRPR